jgi:hypothetical protein
MKKHVALAWTTVLVAGTFLPTSYSEPSAPYLPYIEGAGLSLLLIYIKQLHASSATFVYTSFYQIYSLVGTAISLLFISSGTPMLEIDKDGTANGAMWAGIIFLVVGLQAGLAGYASPATKIDILTKNINRSSITVIIFIISSIVLAIGLFIFLTYGGAAFSGVTRVAFWTSIVPNHFKLYPSLLGQTFFLIAFLYLERREKTKKTGASSTFLIAYIFTTIVVSGEKFSTFIYYATVWMAICAGIYNRNIVHSRTISLGVGAVSILLLITAVSYTAADKEAVFILYRIAMQGQLLWSVLTEQSQILLAGLDWSCAFGCGVYESGTDFISARYLPTGIWESYVETGSGLTGFMPALPILTYGFPMALAIHATISYTLGILQKYLVSSLSRREFVVSFLLFKSYFGFLVSWYAMKESTVPGAIVTFGLLLIWIVIFKYQESD